MNRLIYCIMTSLYILICLFALYFFDNFKYVFIVHLVVSIILMAVSSYRLENIGWMSGYAWICLIPFFNLPLIYYCCHLPMNYVVHGKVDLPGKIIRTVFLILSLIPLAGIIASVIADISTL